MYLFQSPESLQYPADELPRRHGLRARGEERVPLQLELGRPAVLALLRLLSDTPNSTSSLSCFILGDKMNLTVRLCKLFYESSNGVPALQPCSQLPTHSARGD